MDFLKKNTGLVFILATVVLSVGALVLLVALRGDGPTQRERELQQIAGDLGLDEEQFLEDFRGNEVREIVEAQKQDIAERRGGSLGTPTLVIDGEIQENLPSGADEFEALVRAYISSEGAELPITVEVFEDFNCPFCATFFPLSVVADERIDDSEAVFEQKHLPFLRDSSYVFAYAVEAAKMQDERAGLEFAAIIFSNEHDVDYDNLQDIIASDLPLENQENEQSLESDVESDNQETDTNTETQE